MKSVELQIRKERMEKIDERERKIKLKKYHKKILDDPNIKYVEENLSDSKSQVTQYFSSFFFIIGPIRSVNLEL